MFCFVYEVIAVWLGPDASSTQSKIFALLLALKNIKGRKKNSIIVCDSQAALNSIQGRKCKWELSKKLINIAHKLIADLSTAGVTIILLWIPSHRGVSGNEMINLDFLENNVTVELESFCMIRVK